MAQLIAIGSLGICVDIGNKKYYLRSIEDIKRLPQEEVIGLLYHVMFIDRPQILAEANKVPELKSIVEKLEKNVEALTAEKEYYFKAQTVEDLSDRLVQYHNENVDLQNQVNRLTASNKTLVDEVVSLRADVDSLKALYHGIAQPLWARQIAMDADEEAMKLVFPDAKKKPFCFRSFGNIVSFIKKPSSTEFTSPLGPQAWIDLGSEKTEEIKKKVQELIAARPYLGTSIKTLKNSAWKEAHTTTSVEATVEFYRNAGKEELAEAVEECAEFLKSLTVQTVAVDVKSGDSASSELDSANI